MPVLQSSSKPGVAQVRAQCDRILASKGFVRSGRQRAFLEFIVNAALEGKADRLKEFTLGIEVFEKDEKFDPSIDAIVRVEASRLRSKLSEYYVSEGQGDTVRINIPKGHYVPEFVFAATPSTDRSASGTQRLGLGLALAAIFAALIYYNYWLPQREPNVTANTERSLNSASVAVLPLRDRSSAPESYFGESMTDELITSLGDSWPLQVTSLASVRMYADSATPMREIGRALGVTYIVDGSIVRSDERVKIVAHLTDAHSDAQIWSRTFEKPVVDMAKMPGEVAAEIAAKISGEMLKAAEPNSDDVNMAAYEAYLKGRYFYNQFTAEGFRRSIDFYQEAIRIEPDYAEAYAGLASCHCLLAGHGLEMASPVVAIPQAHSFAMKALSLNPEMAEPQAFLGIISFKFGWDSDKAESQLERAIMLNPSLYQAYVWHSQVLEALGQNEKAVGRARAAKRLNPLSLAVSLNLGWQLYQSGQYIEASAEIEKLIDFNGNFWGAHWARGHIYNKYENYDKAISEFQLAAELEGGHSLPLSALGYTYAIAGKTDEALEVIAELETLSKAVYVSPFHLATIYAGLDQPDEMFRWLEKAFVVRARSLAWMHVTDELLPFVDDARFQDLVRRIGISSTIESDVQARNSP